MGLFGNKDITGIDIGAGGIKIARIAWGRKRPKLLSATLIDISPDPDRAEGVGASLRYLASQKKPVCRKRVIALFPGQDITIRSLTLPKMPAAELGEAVRWEAKRHISYPLDAALVEYLVIGERCEGAVDKYDILLVAAERSKVVEHLAPFREAGIAVSAVDANALALRNVLRLRENTGNENQLVVDMGAGKTEINIFKGGVLRFCRCVQSGGLDMTRAVADRMGVELEKAEAIKQRIDVLSPTEDDEAVAAVKTALDSLFVEIRRSVEYYKTTFREKKVGRAILTGGVALTAGIKEYFSLSFDGDVELDRPFEGLTGDTGAFEELEPHALRFAAAVGLALRKA